METIANYTRNSLASKAILSTLGLCISLFLKEIRIIIKINNDKLTQVIAQKRICIKIKILLDANENDSYNHYQLV